MAKVTSDQNNFTCERCRKFRNVQKWLCSEKVLLIMDKELQRVEVIPHEGEPPVKAPQQKRQEAHSVAPPLLQTSRASQQERQKGERTLSKEMYR